MAQTQRAVIERRRQAVSRQALRGLSTREIESLFERMLLANPVEAERYGVVNPKTGKAWSHSTIARDINVVEQQWREATIQERTEHLARQVAELREARRYAWQKEDVTEVRLNIVAEAELLGTKAPARFQEVPFDLSEFDLDPQDVIDAAERIVSGQ